MPKSRVRKKKDAPVVLAAPVKARRKQSPRWMGPLIIAMWSIGALYLITAYFTNFYEGVGTMEDLGNWHIAIGFSFIAAGFALATQWE
ncbi:MAG: cell division protein CrgA [Mycobacteriales bacterium]